MGPLRAAPGSPAPLAQLEFQDLAWGPGGWNLLSLPPTSRSSNVRWRGLELALLFGDIWTAHQPFSLQEEKCSLRLMCLGFVCLGLERPSNCPFPCGVWWVTFPSSSPRKKNKQLRAHGSSCGTLSKTERRGKKNSSPKCLVKSKALGYRKELELLHNLQFYQGNLKIHP